MTTTPDPAKSQVTLVHVACCLIIVLCVVLRFTVLSDFPEAVYVLSGVGFFLYGKLAFLPDPAVIQKFLQAMRPEDLKTLSLPPPPGKTIVLTSKPSVILVNTDAPSLLPPPSAVPREVAMTDPAPADPSEESHG